MKKLLICLVALLMLLSTSALADAQLDKATELSSSVSLCKYSNCYVARAEDGYHLYDANGNVLSAAYRDIRVAESGQYLKVQNVSNADNINCIGLLDAQGREILPLAYGDIATYHGDGWVLAHVLALTDGDVGEYKDSKGNKYIISRTDVVYNGELIGSLTRDDYQGSYNVYTRGPSIYIKITSQKGYWLDSQFKRVDVTDDSLVDTSEYSSVYKGPVTHNPTQQEAFTASCTLTRDQVEQHVWYDSNKGQLLDLQGNVLADQVYYDSVYYRQNYLEVKANSYRNVGVIGFDGTVIIPPQYKYIAYYTGSLFASGYNAVLDEAGNLYYYDETGKMTASAEYQLSSSDYKGYSYNAPIVHVKNMGKYMIITATHGTLPETYDEALTCGERQPIIAVRKGDVWGAIDMAGNVVVPFEHRNAPEISADGTLVYAQTTDRKYMLYNISYGEAASVPESWTETKTSGEETDTTPVLNEGAWECVCGTITTGKFCPECGSKKPEPTATPAPTPAPAADDGSWTCDCGSVNAGKFCPECGAKKPEATATPAPEPQCASCGYKPEGAAPKFCPECGTKF